MYGNRSKEDMAVTRLYTTDALYRVLERMNELDNQLRQWFIDNRDKEEPNAVFIGYDKNIKPCAPSKIKVSDTITLKPQQRILPIGFWTGNKAKIEKLTQSIDDLITSSPNYNKQDESGFFEINKDLVVKILKVIEKSYIYGVIKFKNEEYKNDIKELLCALTYCCSKSGDKLWAIHRTNRDMSRVRKNGAFESAPDSGKDDLEPSRYKATDRPVIMFFRENGAKKTNEFNENIGWNGAPFYWPVLLTQSNIEPVVYALDQSKNKQRAVYDLEKILSDCNINPQEVLRLTYIGNLEDRFGNEGTTYEEGSHAVETRAVKETTASRFFEKDNSGDWKINPIIASKTPMEHGIYTYNNGIFPFVLRPYKYIVLTQGRIDNANIMILELDEPQKWNVEPLTELNENGDLIDRDSDDVLVHGTDVLVDKNLNTKDYTETNICQWVVEYSIKRVVKFLEKQTIKLSNRDEEINL